MVIFELFTDHGIQRQIFEIQSVVLEINTVFFEIQTLILCILNYSLKFKH